MERLAGPGRGAGLPGTVPLIEIAALPQPRLIPARLVGWLLVDPLIARTISAEHLRLDEGYADQPDELHELGIVPDLAAIPKRRRVIANAPKARSK